MYLNLYKDMYIFIYVYTYKKFYYLILFDNFFLVNFLQKYYFNIIHDLKIFLISNCTSYNVLKEI